MKKKVFILVCLILGVVSVYQKSQTQLPVDEFLLMNVEALASSEYINNTFCEGSGEVLCEKAGVKVAYVFEGYSLRK
jgi:hypothetical protein